MSKRVNPEGVLSAEIVPMLRTYKKTRPLWARIADQVEQIETLELSETAAVGDIICRGIHDELWCQKPEKFESKYIATGRVDEPWHEYRPKPDAPHVNAAVVDFAFHIETSWGNMKGKPGDYVVQSHQDPNDVWVVDKGIFEASYELTGKQA